jgi:hypothetical protein
VRRATFLAVLATTAAVAMVLAGAGTAAGPSTGLAMTKAHGQTAAAAIVRQVGLRNYAGPNCPGAGWNCTTSTRVLQIAGADGQNRAECSSEPVIVGASQTCTISQLGGSSNTARCVQRSTMAGAVQTCDITQTGDNNKAFVDQTIEQKDGSTQLGSQKAIVNQGTASVGSAGGNELHLHQDVKQQVKDGAIQAQNAHQSAVVLQFAAGSGDNASHIDQSQNQKAFGGDNQAQNGADDTAFVADCTLGDFPNAANACANVSQTAVDGENENHMHQSIDEDENGASGSIQRQGTFSGGLYGKVHQATATGSSLNKAKQSKQLKMSGGSSQSQIDPVRCCGTASQIGGAGNSEDIDQSSDLRASNDDAFQSSDLLGESRSVPGTCNISQRARVNGDSANNDSGAVSPCPFLQLGTSCTNGSEGQDGCTTFQEVPCRIDCIDKLPGLNFFSVRPRD